MGKRARPLGAYPQVVTPSALTAAETPTGVSEPDEFPLQTENQSQGGLSDLAATDWLSNAAELAL